MRAFICQACGKGFEARKREAKFCSIPCSNRAKKYEPKPRKCEHCGADFLSLRKTRKFCSRACSNRSAWAETKTRACRHCGTSFPLRGAIDANRQHCSQRCAKTHNAKRIKDWQAEHPDKMREYRTAQVVKNPGLYREQARRNRLESLRLLGGGCVVCGVTNPNWLHIDFIPTTRNAPYRHPRNLSYIRRHLELFRILCANHHYELTLTGQIIGTDITQ
jgi:hypothetical protein